MDNVIILFVSETNKEIENQDKFINEIGVLADKYKLNYSILDSLDKLKNVLACIKHGF